ncbi:hypothetical protein OAL10_00875 [Gammaproteobacteria bacterium]|nr:hypothetical protein [Gammaproteobacteria bacterium]
MSRGIQGSNTYPSANRPLVGYIFGGLFGMLVFRFVFPSSFVFPQGQLNPGI